MNADLIVMVTALGQNNKFLISYLSICDILPLRERVFLVHRHIKACLVDYLLIQFFAAYIVYNSKRKIYLAFLRFFSSGEGGYFNYLKVYVGIINGKLRQKT